MRFLKASLQGYIGFYNGSGLSRVDIDFTKCKNRIILISGMNGSGKSTLMGALSLFPDPSSSFIPNKDGKKILQLFNDGDIYDIRIVSPTDEKGGRKQTKAWISKNGVELNENGNITSYKEIIYTEFELDSNYISLSMLSGTNRGLADKTPAERKKFASTIVSNLETYNNIYKTLNKKSLIFKSHINTLHNKIQNIGSKESIELTLKSLREKEHSISVRIMELNNSIITIQAKNSIDEKESLEIQKVLENIKSLSEEINDIESRLKSYYTSTKIKMESIDSKYNEDIELSSHYSETINNLYTDWKLSVEKLSVIESNILSTKADLESYKYDLDTKMKSKYEESSNRLIEIKKELSLFNIPDNIELIHPLTNLLEFYSRFSSQIDNFYTNCTEFVLDWIINKFDPEIMEKCSQRLSELTEEDRKCNDDIYKLEQVKEKMSVLSSRPSNCNIDSCPFINDALDLKSVYTDNDNIDKKILKIQKRKVDIAKNVTELMKNMEIYRLCLSKKQELDVIRADISNNSSNLSILNDTDLLDINRFNSMIVSGNPFNNQKDPKKCIDILNLLKALESEEKINSLLEVKYQAYQDKLNLINTTEVTLYNLNIDKDNLSKSSTELKSNYDALKNTKSELDRKISIERDYISIYHTYIDKKRVLDSLLEKNAEFERKSSNALASIEVIQNYRSEIDKLTRESKPIVDEISKLSGQLTLLESYYSEYSEYSQSYNMIETLKKYCSPTAGGIQTIFMQIYMNKTLDLANQVLSMLFGGEYKLLEFVINQNEFRIPFIGNGLPVDDVSSGSTSQICIMGMVINLVLLHQASTKFNIARLDEIDGGLDHRNRFEFVNTLYRTMPILNIDQLFIISHSLEADTSAVDIIKLKSYSDFEDTVQLGNVIWDYQEEIKKTFE